MYICMAIGRHNTCLHLCILCTYTKCSYCIVSANSYSATVSWYTVTPLRKASGARDPEKNQAISLIREGAVGVGVMDESCEKVGSTEGGL